MNVIDLEILIPASPDFIWRFLGDISSAANWVEGVTAVSFLTAERRGKGARWRYSAGRGRDLIIEAAAWYDTLGYEYTVVDGAGFGNNQGRIRLQEVTDGTLLRWTFNYEHAGMLGGLRNAMRLKRSTKRQIQSSMQNLHRLIQQESGGNSTHEARATVREAPDVEQRSAYQPRHPSAFVEPASDEMDSQRTVDSALPVSLENSSDDLPQPAEGDTKPNPVILGGGGRLDMALQQDEIEATTEPIGAEIVNIKPRPSDAFIFRIDAKDEAAKASRASEADQALKPIDARQSTPLRPNRQALDTANLSVFEVFGLQKPSETEDAWSSESGSPFRQASRELNETAGRGGSADAQEPANNFDSQLTRDSVQQSMREFEADAVSAENSPASAAGVIGMRRSSRRLAFALRSHQ